MINWFNNTRLLSPIGNIPPAEAEETRRTAAATTDLQGRTPALSSGVLAEWPMVTASLAEKITGANRATVQRNLVMMQDRGLICEVTGQGRYRVWTATI